MTFKNSFYPRDYKIEYVEVLNWFAGEAIYLFALGKTVLQKVSLLSPAFW